MTGGEVARPFLPTRDFDVSKRFYEALGFEKLLDGDVAIFKVGASSFILQRRYQDEWAENCMMQLMVDDVDAWWGHITRLDLPRRFGVRPPQPPAVQPWGLRVLYLTDPSGILWHIAQRRDGVAHDEVTSALVKFFLAFSIAGFLTGTLSAAIGYETDVYCGSRETAILSRGTADVPTDCACHRSRDWGEQQYSLSHRG